MIIPLDLYEIRAHHLLCIQGFQGFGYNQNFVTNLTKVIKDINSYPNLKVKIIDTCDVICSCCPYKKGDFCQKEITSAQKIKNIDLLVLKKLGLKKGVTYKIREVNHLIDLQLKNISDVQDICGDCQWKKKCLWFTSRDNQITINRKL